MKISDTKIRFSDIKPGDIFTWMNIGPFLKTKNLYINIYNEGKPDYRPVNAIHIKSGDEAIFNNDDIVTLVENSHDNR